MHRFAGSETESEAAALDKEFWVKRAAEVRTYMYIHVGLVDGVLLLFRAC